MNDRISAALIIAILASTDSQCSPRDEISSISNQQLSKLIANDGAAFDDFGRVAIDGNRVIVGSYRSDVGANSSQGAVYVFVREGSNWVQEAKLIASDGAAGDQFGRSVAFLGNTALIGAPIASISGVNTQHGAAYVFTVNSGIWTQRAKLLAVNAQPATNFGESVALDRNSNRALIGAWRDDIGSNIDQGSAYVFTGSGDLWAQTAKLIASDGAASDEFGESVDIQGDTILIGAWGDDVAANGNQGSAYVFVRNGDAWSQEAKLVAADGAAGDRFGFSLSLSNGTALIGSQMDDVGSNSNQGSAYFFSRNGTIWTQQQKLVATDGALNDRFGFSVAHGGNLALIGAFVDDVGAMSDQGSVRLFIKENQIWSESATLVASDGASGDQFGVSVDVDTSRGTAIIGAQFDDIGSNTDQGSAYIFQVGETVFLDGFEGL